MKYAEKCHRIYAEVKHSCVNTWRRLVRNVESKLEQRRTKKEKESSADRAARVTASATKWMAFFTFVLAATSVGTVWILRNQLTEMHKGGIDTHDLAVAAGKQADAAKAQSEQAKAQTKKMAESLRKTDALIRIASEQAVATTKLVEAAKQQADTASAGLRPWIRITTVELRPGIGPIKTLGFHWPLTGALVPPMVQVKVSMLNVGHLLAQDVEVIPELFFGKFQSDKWYEVVTNEQQRFCKSVINNTPTGAAKVVFPSDPMESEMGVGGIVHDADIMHVPGNPASYAAASLIICVNYRGDGITRYQTQARSGLYEDDQVFIDTGLDVNADRLKLIREPNSDHAN
jgi:hypothetical protein